MITKSLHGLPEGPVGGPLALMASLVESRATGLPGPAAPGGDRWQVRGLGRTGSRL